MRIRLIQTSFKNIFIFHFVEKKTKNVGKVMIHKNIQSNLGFEKHQFFLKITQIGSIRTTFKNFSFFTFYQKQKKNDEEVVSQKNIELNLGFENTLSYLKITSFFHFFSKGHFFTFVQKVMIRFF